MIGDTITGDSMKGYGREVTRTLALAFPMVLGQLGAMAMGWVDAAMVGHGLGTTELAALALGGTLVYFFLIPGFGLAQAISVLAARAIGSGQRESLQRILRHGLVVTGTFTAIVSSGMLFLSEVLPGWIDYDLMLFLGQPPEVVAAAKPYLLFFAPAAVPVLLFSCLRAFSEALDRPWTPFAVLISAVLLNVFLNWVLIFGNLGAPRLELAGAGLATLLSHTYGLVVMGTIVMRLPVYNVGLRLLNFTRCSVAGFRETLGIGVPSGLQIFFEVGAFNVAMIMMGWLGEVPQAAHMVVLQLAAMSFMVPLGISFAIAIRVGKAAGEGDRPAVRRIAGSGVMFAAGWMAMIGVLFATFNEFFPQLFSADPAVIELAAELLLFAAIFQVFDGTQTTTLGALRGLTDVRIPTYLVMGNYWGLMLPLAYVLGFMLDGGPSGVWQAIAIGLGVVAVILVLRLRAVTRRSPEELQAHREEAPTVT